MNKIGREEGDVCNREQNIADATFIQCGGIIGIEPSKNCSCHISAPCDSCVSARPHCAVCGWSWSDEV